MSDGPRPAQTVPAPNGVPLPGVTVDGPDVTEDAALAPPTVVPPVKRDVRKALK